MTEIDFHFDFISPYGYLGWIKGNELCRKKGWTLNPRPIVFGAVLDACGQLGPAEIPAKRAFVIRDAMRKFAAIKIPMAWPKLHPFNPLTALRLALKEVSGNDQVKVIDAIWKAGWIHGEDLSSEDVLSAALKSAGLPAEALLERTRDPAVKARLKEETQRAIELGVFGVPTFVHNGEIFWGEDQIGFLEQKIEGRETLDEKVYRAILVSPRGVDRKVLRK